MFQESTKQENPGKVESATERRTTQRSGICVFIFLSILSNFQFPLNRETDPKNTVQVCRTSILTFKVSHKKRYFIDVEFSNFRISKYHVPNVCLLSSSSLCPVGCLSFVR